MKNANNNNNSKNNKSSLDKKTKDSEAHYDMDGVSLSANDDVVVSGDNQTTQGAPLPQNIFPKPQLKNSANPKMPT